MIEITPLQAIIIFSTIAFICGFFFGWNAIFILGETLLENYCQENPEECNKAYCDIESKKYFAEYGLNQKVFIDVNP